jgi:transposase
VVDAFIGELDMVAMGFEGAMPALTGRPSYHPSVLLKVYLYGYLNRIQSSRRLERECQRNLELMWLTGRLAPDFKTIADFRRDNGKRHPQRLPPLCAAVSRNSSCSRRLW